MRDKENNYELKELVKVEYDKSTLLTDTILLEARGVPKAELMEEVISDQIYFDPNYIGGDVVDIQNDVSPSPTATPAAQQKFDPELGL